jgi:hypothetical protein
LPAGNTTPAKEIRKKNHLLPLLKANRFRSQYTSGYFMTQYAGIFKIRLNAFKSMEICATYTHPQDLKERMAGSPYRVLFRPVFKMTRLGTNQGSHIEY